MPAAKLFGEPSRLIQMYSIANMRIYFGMAKEKAETFYGSRLKFKFKKETNSENVLAYYLYL